MAPRNLAISRGRNGQLLENLEEFNCPKILDRSILIRPVTLKFSGVFFNVADQIKKPSRSEVATGPRNYASGGIVAARSAKPNCSACRTRDRMDGVLVVP